MKLNQVIEELSELKEMMIEPNRANACGLTPLMVAAQKGHVQKIKALCF